MQGYIQFGINLTDLHIEMPCLFVSLGQRHKKLTLMHRHKSDGVSTEV